MYGGLRQRVDQIARAHKKEKAGNKDEKKKDYRYRLGPLGPRPTRVVPVRLEMFDLDKLNHKMALQHLPFIFFL